MTKVRVVLSLDVDIETWAEAADVQPNLLSVAADIRDEIRRLVQDCRMAAVGAVRVEGPAGMTRD